MDKHDQLSIDQPSSFYATDRCILQDGIDDNVPSSIPLFANISFNV